MPVAKPTLQNLGVRMDDAEKRLQEHDEILKGQLELIRIGERLVKYIKIWAPIMAAAIVGAGVNSDQLTAILNALAGLGAA